jgi:Protein of unknown function (DUF2634).
MFPFDLEDEDIDLEELAETKQFPEDYEIDFATGRLTGNIITGLDAVAQWARLALNIPRYVYPQYSWDYGSELETLIGDGYDTDYIESEVSRMVTDALSPNEDIEGIRDLACKFEDGRLIVSFTLVTVYGETEVDGIYV